VHSIRDEQLIFYDHYTLIPIDNFVCSCEKTGIE
jgi:hypothetical protein